MGVSTETVPLALQKETRPAAARPAPAQRAAGLCRKPAPPAQAAVYGEPNPATVRTSLSCEKPTPLRRRPAMFRSQHALSHLRQGRPPDGVAMLCPGTPRRPGSQPGSVSDGWVRSGGQETRTVGKMNEPPSSWTNVHSIPRDDIRGKLGFRLLCARC